MTRNEKVKMLEDARGNMQSQYAAYFERGNLTNLQCASYFANIVTALIADID